MLSFVKNKYPFFFFLIFFLIFFRKVFLLGLMPIPSDLLISFYFPFSSGGFKEYSPWVPNKAQVADDSLRQQYPWKTFSAQQLTKGELPLWNPYAFSGYPLLANVQTAVFYPFNLLFLILNPKTAWTILILLQPILGALFMYLFLRSSNLSKLAATFGGLAFIGMTFELFWLEQMIIGHTTIWLPLILFSIQKFFAGKQRWIIICFIGLILSVLGGYSQTTVYVLIVSSLFYVYRVIRIKENHHYRFHFLIGLCLLVLTIGICAVQLIPTAEIYLHSAREGRFSEKLYSSSLAPVRNILTLLSADFFGNMATHNYWGDQHTDFNHFFGAIPLLVLLTGLYLSFKNKIPFKDGKFFLLIGLFFWLFAIPTPFGYLPSVANIPILSTGVVARFLFIFQFSMCIASSYALDIILKTKKTSLKPAVLILITISICLGVLYYLYRLNVGADIQKNYSVGIRNLTYSMAIFFSGLAVLKLSQYLINKKIALFLLLCIASLEIIYLGNKYLPFSKKEYLFPSHPLFEFLAKEADINRIWGQGTTYLTTNFPTVYKLHYSDGYDSLFIKRYSQLVYSARDGKIPEILPRSDVNLSPNKENWLFKERMLDLLGIKYILDKNDSPKNNFEPEIWKYPDDRYKLIWQEGKFKVYQNLKSWPRIYFASKVDVRRGDQEIIDSLLYSKDNNLAVVEENLPVKVETNIRNNISRLQYDPNKVRFQTESDKTGYLVLSDNFFPGWKASIDGKLTKIYRTNYTFRGIIVPDGKHHIEFYYDPISMKIGLLISFSSLLLSIFFFIFLFKKR